MASISIQGRVDEQLWDSLKLPGETNTQLLQRLCNHYQATQSLDDIAPTSAAAVAVLRHSHALLNQIVNGSSVQFSEVPAQPTQPAATAAEPTHRPDDDW
jgi:hypothetical protein